MQRTQKQKYPRAGKCVANETNESKHVQELDKENRKSKQLVRYQKQQQMQFDAVQTRHGRARERRFKYLRANYATGRAKMLDA